MSHPILRHTLRPTLIGITGLAGSGKDTVRSILEDAGYSGFAFADPMRSMLRELLTGSNIDDKYMDSREFKEAIIPELGVSYRQMAQTLGTEWGRVLKPDFWLKLATSYLYGQMDAGGNAFCISDVRFDNEANWVRNHDGIIWRVERPGTEPVHAHSSEQGAHTIKPDLVIYNVGTVGDLYNQVSAALDIDYPRLRSLPVVEVDIDAVHRTRSAGVKA
jgi:hypothetical protein